VGSSFDKETGDPKGRYRALNQRLRGILQGPDADFELFVVEASQNDAAAKALSDMPAGLSSWMPEPLTFPQEPSYEALRVWARPLGITSFTGLQHRAEVEGDPEPSAPGLSLPSGALPAGSGTGILLHAMLEKVELATLQGRDVDAWLALPETVALLEEELRLADLPFTWADRVGSMVHGALTLALPLPGGDAVALRDLEPGHILRELRFLEPFPGAPDFLTGSLDALFEHRGRTYVLDWKSNLLPAYGAEALETCVREHYELQVRIYTLAVLAFLGIRDEADYEARFGGALYVFLRGLPEGVWNERPAWDEVLHWRRALAELRPFDGVAHRHEGARP
jgi:exodeoxyribonuclease V beta subunit